MDTVATEELLDKGDYAEKIWYKLIAVDLVIIIDN